MTRSVANDTTALILNSPSTQPASALSRGLLDISRGAGRIGLPFQVLIDAEALEIYCEPDAATGHNVIGCILTALARHLMEDGTIQQAIEVGLRSREDGQAVDVFLSVEPLRQRGKECLCLRLAGERSTELCLGQ